MINIVLFTAGFLLGGVCGILFCIELAKDRENREDQDIDIDFDNNQ